MNNLVNTTIILVFVTSILVTLYIFDPFIGKDSKKSKQKKDDKSVK